MMDPIAWRTISHIAVFLGSGLALLGGIGTWYFGNQVEKIMPFRQPINAASATVEIIVDSDEQIDTTYMTEGGLLAFVKNRQSLLLVSDTKSRARQTGKGEVIYKGNFQIQSNYSQIGKPVEVLQESDLIQIEFNKIPENSKVLGGKASIIVNGNLRFEFEIPQQQMNGNKIIICEIKNKFLMTRSSE